MVAIPQIFRDKIASSVVGAPRLDTSSEEIGQSINQGADQTASAGFNVAIEKQNLRNEGEYASLMVQHSQNIMSAAEGIKKQYASNPDAMVPALSKAIGDSLDNVSKQASNPFVKLMVERGDPAAQMWAMRQINQDAYEQGYKNTVAHAATTLDGLTNQATRIGGNMDLSADDMVKNTLPLAHVIGQLHTSIATSAHADLADEVSNKGMMSVMKGLIDSTLESQPVKAAQLLQNPEVTKYFPPDQIKKYQTAASTAIQEFPKRMVSMQVQQDLTNHPKWVNAAMTGQMTYAQVDRQERMDTTGLHTNTYNYLKDIILGAGQDNDLKDAAMKKAQIIDDASKLGFRLKDDPTDLAQTGADKKAQISSNVRDLYKLQDELLDGQRRGLLSKEEANTLYGKLYVPLVASTMKNHDPNWFQKQASNIQSFWSGKGDMPGNLNDFNGAYHVIENYLGLDGGKRVAQDFGGQFEAKSKLYDNYFKELDETKGKIMPNSNQPWTPREVAYHSLGIQADGKNTYDFGPFGRRVITGHDSDGNPLFHSTKEDDERVANMKALKTLQKQGTP